MLLLLTAFDVGLVRFQVALDPCRQSLDLVRSAWAAVEMPAEGVVVVGDFAAIGQRPRRALVPVGIAGALGDVGVMRVGFAGALVPLPERGRRCRQGAGK